MYRADLTNRAGRLSKFRLMTTLRPILLVSYIVMMSSYLHAVSPEGYVIQWGWNTAAARAEAPRLVASNAVAVAAGSGHSLALKRDGTVFGWGGNLVGNATGEPTTNAPYLSAGVVKIGGQVLSNVVSIVASRGFSLALRADGTVVTWGENYVPEGLTNIAGIAAGWNTSWALKRDGTVLGWANDPSWPDYGHAIPAKNLSNVVAIAFGPGAYTSRGVALIHDGTVETWGSESVHRDATAPAELRDVLAVCAGANHTLALKRDGTVVGWGFNSFGQATGSATKETPSLATSEVKLGDQVLNNVACIAAGPGYSIAAKKDGRVVAWGRVGGGLYPVAVPDGLGNVVAVAAGEDFCLAITTNAVVAERFRR